MEKAEQGRSAWEVLEKGASERRLGGQGNWQCRDLRKDCSGSMDT